MKNTKKIKQPENVRRTIYLPREVDNYLEERSDLDGRSVSNYITQMVKAKMGENN